ncbi:MAG: monovalent cation:proton antiporter-2 (CPA2) family protein [Bauldia sp.]
MAVESTGADLVPIVALLGAGVVAVPIFKRIGLGAVIGYLVAGLAIGPFGLRLFTEAGSILSVAELGVVLLLFVIGLELKPSRLWSLRRDIFGLGAAQVVVCGALLAGGGILAGVDPAVALIAAMGLALSSTAIVLQILEEEGETAAPHGRKIFSVLLLQDLAIVPFLAIEAVLAPAAPASTGPSRWIQAGIAIAVVLAVIFVGRYLLNPVFRIFAAAKAREVMTAAALLVVLGAALAMEASGLSMAMGAFLAGVLLSESSFRHQLEADIEPFRGLLLGLFFLGVGMSLDVGLIVSSWYLILAAVVAFVILKAAGIYTVARVRSDHREALKIALDLAQGGEFAFVLYANAAGVFLLDRPTMAFLNAAVILSMALTPLAPFVIRKLLPPKPISLDGIEVPDGLSGTALIIGFGRFGQVASQALLSRGIDVSIIDDDTEMIRSAGRFGFKIYYGDGTRLDVLRAAGAGTAKAIAVCIDNPVGADRIVELIKSEFPLARLLVRSFDRGHTLRLIGAGVDYQIRETFESALAFGEAALRELGTSPEEAAEIVAEVRRRDEERLELQMAEGIFAGRDLVRGAQPVPTPLSAPKRPSQALSEETAAVQEPAAAETAGGEN